jgi:hypothetical protein
LDFEKITMLSKMLRWHSKLKVDGGVQIKYLKLMIKITGPSNKID